MVGRTLRVRRNGEAGVLALPRCGKLIWKR